MPIGVFDSGLGGLTILDRLRRALPEQDFVYLGDSANAPYGSRPARQVYELTIQNVQRLFDADCQLVILACNTASAVALHNLQVDLLDARAHRVLGVFVPVIEHLTRRDWGDNAPPTHTGLRDVALFATPATVASGAFPRELRFRARDVTVEAQACVGLVEAIEAGDLDGARGIAAKHVAALLARLPEPQAAVLGCTHYPLVEDAFRAALPAGVGGGDTGGSGRRQPCRLSPSPSALPRRVRRGALPDDRRPRPGRPARGGLHRPRPAVRRGVIERLRPECDRRPAIQGERRRMSETHDIAILGASGYTGAELVRLIAGASGPAHPRADRRPQGRRRAWARCSRTCATWRCRR